MIDLLYLRKMSHKASKDDENHFVCEKCLHTRKRTFNTPQCRLCKNCFEATKPSVSNINK